MDSYNELFKTAKKNNKAKQRTAKYVKFETKGQTIVGAFIAVQPVVSKLGEGSYNQYLFETDEGLTKFALGRNADSEIKPILLEGGIYAIEYQGQEKLAGGKSVNKFEIYELNPDDVEPDKKPKAKSNVEPVNTEQS